MRKIALLLFILLTTLTAYSEPLQDVGISKYAVLEVLDDNTPLRNKDSENASRLGNLFKDAVLFADKQNDKYFRVELSENNYAWVNKKYVEVQAIIPEKRFENIEKITFKDEKNYHLAKIEISSGSAFVIKEDGANLFFTLYDNRFDPIETKLSDKNSKFTIPDKIQNEFNINYINDSNALFGYDVEKYEKGYILKVKKAPKINKKRPLKNITVVVDAGHGGNDAGACAFNLKEKDLNLEISKKLKKELSKKGAKVYLTRKKDVAVKLRDRINFAKEKNADILLSIHQNSVANPSYLIKKHGVGTYYYHPQSKPLAQKIQQNLVADTKFRDDNINYASFAIIRPSAQLSVLIECGYIVKEDEAKKLSDKNFQKLIAKSITKGCEDYLKETFLNHPISANSQKSL